MPNTRDEDRRVTVSIRVKPAALDRIDARAARDARSRSEMTRLLLAYAVDHMPDGWRPAAPKGPRS